MKWLRWQGLVAFVALMALIVGLWIWLSDWWIARTIERVGGSTLGAQLDVAAVDLKITDGRFSLSGLQLTNASKPTHNLLEVGTIEAQIDTAQLAWKRIHLDEVSVRDIKFNTERASPGWVAQDQSSGIAQFVPALTSFDWNALGDKDSALAVLDSLELQSIQAIKGLQADIDQAKKTFESKLNALPNEEKLKSYQQRFKALKSEEKDKGLNKGLAFLGKAKDADKLRKEVKTDIQQVKALRDQLKKDYEQLKKRYAEVKAAPEKDVDALLANFSFDAPGTEKLISGVLGPELEQKLQSGVSLYKNAEPWVNKARVIAGQDVNAPPPPARFAGVDVHFKEADPQPEFWLKKARLSGELLVGQWAGAFDGQIKNVSDTPALIVEPLSLDFSAKGAQGGLLSVSAELDARGQIPKVQLNGQWRGLQLGALSLSENRDLQLRTQQAAVAGRITAQSYAENTELELDVNFSELLLSANTQQKNEMVKSIVTALGETEQFSLRLNYQAQGESVKRSLSSSLDDIVKKAVRQALKQALVQQMDKAKAKLLSQADDALKPLTASLTEYGELDTLLGDQLKSLESVLPL